MVKYRTAVGRHDVIAWMRASGVGAFRGSAHIVHTHITLWGPIFAPPFKGINLQSRPGDRPGYRDALDPEEFSFGGKGTPLPYSRSEDERYDDACMSQQRAAVTFCDHVLDRFGDAAVTEVKVRERWEAGTGFDYNVDQRIWFLWQRLANRPHPFSPSQVEEYRQTLLDLVRTAPRLTGPIVEPTRRAEYRTLRAQPLKAYGK